MSNYRVYEDDTDHPMISRILVYRQHALAPYTGFLVEGCSNIFTEYSEAREFAEVLEKFK